MKIAGTMLMLIGVGIVLFSGKIVFPGMELLLGIETIVGADNVVYPETGGYVYTNPMAMFRWIAAVVGIGLCIFGVGVVLFRMKRDARPGVHGRRGSAPQ